MLFGHTSNFVGPSYRCCAKGLKKGDVKFIISLQNLDWMRWHFSLILSCINPWGLLLHNISQQSSLWEHQSKCLRFDLCSIIQSKENCTEVSVTWFLILALLFWSCASHFPPWALVWSSVKRRGWWEISPAHL